jgi:DNA gyrase/topoisomerase IV subunit B
LILSLKFQEPQFSGQTKERLSSREASNIVLNIAKDAFAAYPVKPGQKQSFYAQLFSQLLNGALL